MFSSIQDLFEGAAAKYLSAVDAEPSKSHQHEIGGLPSVGFKKYLGEPGKNEEYRFACTMAYISDDNEIELCTDTVTWYDTRRNVQHRGPEYRLYYKSNPVTENLRAGDFFLIAKRTDGSLLLVFTPRNSVAEHQLIHLFGVNPHDERFRAATLPDTGLILPLRILLEELGIPAFDEMVGQQDLELVLTRFPQGFPNTEALSSLARELQPADAKNAPDEAILLWMEREEALFRAYERHLVAEKLREGFGAEGDDVDEFISFSLSVQNRRKSRVGRAFENHLSCIFQENELPFEKGGGKKVTENNAKPDFLFPGFEAYHDADWPRDKIFLLGAKTTCKDRWRQVLAEGDLAPQKYLITLEAGISSQQTDEMRSKALQLIVPAGIQPTYTSQQRQWLFNLRDFICLVSKRLLCT